MVLIKKDDVESLSTELICEISTIKLIKKRVVFISFYRATNSKLDNFVENVT